MSDKIKVKFKEDGKWADNPSEPIFEVEAGEVLEVSANLANIVVDAGKGKIVKREQKPKEPKEGDTCELENGDEGVLDKKLNCVKVKK